MTQDELAKKLLAGYRHYLVHVERTCSSCERAYVKCFAKDKSEAEELIDEALADIEHDLNWDQLDGENESAEIVGAEEWTENGPDYDDLDELLLENETDIK